MRQPAVGLVDDLRAGALEVRLPVGRIVVLIGVEIAVRILHVDLADHADGAVGALVRVAVNRLRAVRFEDALALLRWHCREAPVSPYSRDSAPIMAYAMPVLPLVESRIVRL